MVEMVVNMRLHINKSLKTAHAPESQDLSDNVLKYLNGLTFCHLNNVTNIK